MYGRFDRRVPDAVGGWSTERDRFWSVNRQLNASVNLYLRMRGFPPSMRVWEEIVPQTRGGVGPLDRGETDDTPPMNPEGDEADAPKADTHL